MACRKSLLIATDSRDHVHLVVGANQLAASRCNQILAVGAHPVLVTQVPIPQKISSLPTALQVLIEQQDVRCVYEEFRMSHLFELGRPEADNVVDAVFVTDLEDEAAIAVSAACRRHRIPVNVVDRPSLCSFSLLSTFSDGPLQVGITTNGSGCKLAARIRREVAAALPEGMGDACARLGTLRRRIQEEDMEEKKVQCEIDDQTRKRKRALSAGSVDSADFRSDDCVLHDQPPTFNKLISDSDSDARRTRRMRWLSQMCEYWPLKRLATITDANVETLLRAYSQAKNNGQSPADDVDHVILGNANVLSGASGRIILAGSGPGHPDMLTRAVHHAILSADFILADKLVPQGVLDLIPRRTKVCIARKFPGNADAAQDELVEQAVAAARQGKTVLRLKQGDPFVYGRGGEEVLRLRAAGFDQKNAVIVLPGLTSALSAPLFAGIPPTHRDAADQVLICTGTGKKGCAPQPPEYRESRTAVFLMALHRITGLVTELTEYTVVEKIEQEDVKKTEGQPQVAPRVLWPKTTPCAVIERASCPDQKVIRTTLAHVVEAIEQEGSRPPGLLVVGQACGVLHVVPVTLTSGALPSNNVIGEKQRPWVVEDGFPGFDFSNNVPPTEGSIGGGA